MADVLRIKRRITGSPGAPPSLANAELAYNEVDHILYYGEGTGGGGGTASVIVGVAGNGIGQSVTLPLVNAATALTGNSTSWSRSDHVHPTDITRAPLASPTFTGTVTIGGTIAGSGMVGWSASPGPIGATTASSGAFTTLTASGAVSGAGFAVLHAAPGPIGSTTPSTGAFTTLSASGVVSGAGFNTLFASPPAIGATAAATGAFTNLTATGVVSGAGFTTLFATPPSIGSTTPGTGSFTNLTAVGTVSGTGFTTLLAPYALLASPSFTGTVTIGGSITGAGMTAWSASPGPIGSATPSTGAFTSLSASGAVTGAGITALFAAPGPIGSGTPSSGAFATLSVTGAITGTGVNTLFSSPPPIGSVAPATGAFTNLAVTGVVSGVGFSNYFATPPAIGGTTPAAGAFTSLTATGTISGAGVTALLLPYAPLASPVFTGTPSLPTGTVGITQTNGDDSTRLATTAYVLDTRLNQFQVPTGPVSFNGQAITNLLNPVNAQDGATKSYVDQNVTGLSARGSAAVGTSGSNIALTGLLTIDGYTTIAGDRVLVKDQTLPQNNGIYVAAAGAWTRATDMDAWSEVPNAYVFVVNGTVNSNSSWVCNSALGGTLGTSPITWVQFSQQASVTAGTGLTRTGNTFDAIGTANRISVLADSIDIASSYVGQASIVTLGSVTTGTWNATTIAVARGGTGAVTLTGYLRGNGVSAFTGVSTIPNTDITGLGTMSTQAASAVAITGGTIDGITFDMGVF